MSDKLAENDAWILLALLLSARKKEPVALVDVIANADYLNHAIPTLGELDEACFRLSKSGWIVGTVEDLSPSEKAKRMYDGRKDYEGPTISHWDFVNGKIGAKGWRSHLKKDDPTVCKFPGLHQKDYDEACEAYLKRQN
ncbi:MAG: hypothetical protein AAF438_17830 [Pseudomonadota bacterium]